MTALNIKAIWKDILENIKLSVSPAIFSTWFSQTYLIDLLEKGNRYVAQVGCNSSYVKTTIESRYFGLVQDSLAQFLKKPCDLIFFVKPNQEKTSLGKSEIAPLFEQDVSEKENLTHLLTNTRIKANYSFDNFAVSSSNQMAWAAAEAVAKNVGAAYNPLFVWGGVGVGKTHLMNAVGLSILRNDPEAKVYLCTGEEFTNDIVEGIRNKTTQVFRNKYRRLKALFVDDIQFIAGKNAVQEEFFHTFNSLTGAGGQVILTSDRPPSEIAKLEERLRSRFEAGLIVDIAPPDFELRCAILQIKAKEKHLVLPMNIIQLVAGNIESPRKLEGFLIRLISETTSKKIAITEELVESLLGRGTEINDRRIKANPNEVIGLVLKYFSLNKKALLGLSRARPVSLPRQILMYILRTQLNLPLEEVGRVVGGRDHTTVMHAVDKITKMASSDVQIRQDIMEIKSKL